VKKVPIFNIGHLLVGNVEKVVIFELQNLAVSLDVSVNQANSTVHGAGCYANLESEFF
jgi:hypothetical protein